MLLEELIVLCGDSNFTLTKKYDGGSGFAECFLVTNDSQETVTVNGPALYAVDPEEGEILYAVTTEVSGNCYIPPYNGVTVSGAYVKLITTVGNAEQVPLEVDAAATATYVIVALPLYVPIRIQEASRRSDMGKTI